MQRSTDLTDPEEKRRFRECCDLLWEELYEVDCQDRNHPFYHSCCNSFSKRTFEAAHQSHPEGQTSRMVDWLSKHEIADADGFHDHLFKIVQKKPVALQMLPGLNVLHGIEGKVEEMIIDIQERLSHLEKRNSELEVELQQSRSEVKATQQKVVELELKLQKETEERKFAEFINQVNKKLEKQQSTKVCFEHDLFPTKVTKRM